MTEPVEDLPALVEAFAAAMAAEVGSAERARAAAAFNRAFDRYTAAHPEEDVGTFAHRLVEMGAPAGQALADVVHIRALGSES